MKSIKIVDKNATRVSIIDGLMLSVNDNLDSAIEVSTGKVYRPKYHSYLEPGSLGLYAIKIADNIYPSPASYDSIIKYMFGVEKKRNDKYVLIDESLGWIIGNITTVEKDSSEIKYTKKVTKTKTAVGKYVEVVKFQSTFDAEVIPGNIKYMTEDGLLFDTKQKANTHQVVVEKGKEAAAIAINNKIGWVAAEQIYNVTAGDAYKENMSFKTLAEKTCGVIETGNPVRYKFLEHPLFKEYGYDVSNQHFVKDDAEKVATLILSIKHSHDKLIEIFCK